MANTWKNQNNILGRNIIDTFRSLRRRAQDDLVGFSKNVTAEFEGDGVEFVNRLWSQGGPIREFIQTVIEQDMYKMYARRLSVNSLELAKNVSSWRCYVNYSLLELHNRLFRKNHYGPKSNPGWYDTKQIVYAAKVDMYVSDDRRQREMTEVVGDLAGLSTRIVSYESFRTQLS